MFGSKRRAERMAHNDRDYQCKFWWGDRSGSIGLDRERCRLCNPPLGECKSVRRYDFDSDPDVWGNRRET